MVLSEKIRLPQRIIDKSSFKSSKPGERDSGFLLAGQSALRHGPDADEPPAITRPSAFTVAENTTAVATLTLNDNAVTDLSSLTQVPGSGSQSEQLSRAVLRLGGMCSHSPPRYASCLCGAGHC